MPKVDVAEIGYTRLDVIICAHGRIDFWNYSEQKLQMPFWRLYYPFNRCGFITYQGQERALEPGRIYLIAPETPFSSRKTEEILDKIVMHFLLEEDYCNCRNAIFDFPADAALSQLAGQLCESLDSDEKSIRSSMNGLAFCAAALAHLPAEQLGQIKSIDPCLRELVRAIRREPRQEHKNIDMAKKMGVSPTIFVRRFSAAFGLPPQQFILEERLRLAASLLLHSNLSIEEIADQAGFCDRYYFTRAFTKFRYISPAKFRKGNTVV